MQAGDKCVKNVSENTGTKLLVNVGVGLKMLLRRILKKYNMKICFGMGTSERILNTVINLSFSRRALLNGILFCLKFVMENGEMS
jgi:hypothetical protein